MEAIVFSDKALECHLIILYCICWKHIPKSISHLRGREYRRTWIPGWGDLGVLLEAIYNGILVKLENEQTRIPYLKQSEDHCVTLWSYVRYNNLSGSQNVLSIYFMPGLMPNLKIQRWLWWTHSSSSEEMNQCDDCPSTWSPARKAASPVIQTTHRKSGLPEPNPPVPLISFVTFN